MPRIGTEVKSSTSLGQKTAILLLMASALGAGFLIAIGLPLYQSGQPQPPQLPAGPTPMLTKSAELTVLQTAACYDPSGNPLQNCTPTEPWADFKTNADTCLAAWLDPDITNCSATRAGGKTFALAYLVTKNTSFRDAAISEVIRETQPEPNGEHPLSGERGQQMLDANRILDSAAFVYSWLKNDLTSDQKNLLRGYMNRMVEEIYFEFAKSSDPLINPYYKHNQWGIGDESNNYFYAHLLVATHVGVATYGENDFRVPLNITDQNCSFYTNRPACPTNAMDLYMNEGPTNHFNQIIPFVYEKLDREALPYLATYGRGGGWQEGLQYGAGNYQWLSLLLQDGGFRNFMAESNYSRENARFLLYAIQPGDEFLQPLGDAGRDKTFNVSPYEREDMLVLAAGLQGSVESQYLQYQLNHIHTSIPGGWQQSLFKNFILQDPTLPERNYENELSRLYHAPGLGWINSRTGWPDTAISVSFISTKHIATAHQHKDQNSFDIYSGDGTINGWQLVDANSCGSDPTLDCTTDDGDPVDLACGGSNGIGDSENTKYHNTILFNGLGQFRFYNTPIPSYGEILRVGTSGDFTYWAGEAANAYLDTTTLQRVLSRYTREMAHISGYIFVYDRITPTAGYQNGTVTELFQYPRVAPTINGNVLAHAGGGQKIFQTILLPTTGYTVVPVQNVFSWSGRNHPGACYRAEVQTTTPKTDYRFLIVFQTTADTAPAPQPTQVVRSTDGSMEGGIIQGYIKVLALFSKSGTINTKTVSYQYPVPTSGGTKHFVANLQQNYKYEVRVNNVTVGTYRSSAEGALTFDIITPIGTPTVTLLPIRDPLTDPKPEQR